MSVPCQSVTPNRPCSSFDFGRRPRDSQPRRDQQARCLSWTATTMPAFADRRRLHCRMRDRVIVVTGASSGIGAAAAEKLAAEGATVVLVARRAEALADIAARCGGNAHVIVADVTVRDAVRQVVADAIARAGRIDVWINNAGPRHHPAAIGADGRGRRRHDARQREVRALRDAGSAAALQGTGRRAHHQRVVDAGAAAAGAGAIRLHRREVLRERAHRHDARRGAGHPPRHPALPRLTGHRLDGVREERRARRTGFARLPERAGGVGGGGRHC